ncbi:hypothetical protein HDU87_005975 [Geranomyces variabilis]|uniref:tRNA(Ile)-lysidine/2-thiocytidine synthase N-terminal domain-containing protein n=1 Tax=Geranomyces variabilis TaxID=109894 RepID=A0AAD5TQV0_9FUNG|nr:hypothetical protein HDU87_005975 [Geranomyces variabilis]
MGIIWKGPIGPAEFASVLKRLARDDPGGVLGVGVSGDSKSLAALLLLKKAVGPDRLIALTVDHCLKDGTAAEAARITQQVQKLGIAHHVLPVSWKQSGSLFINDNKDPPRDQNFVKSARLAEVKEALRCRRANLLARACNDLGINTLVIGHSLDDQVRLSLSGMRKALSIEKLAGLKMCDSEIAPASTPAASKVKLWRPVLCFTEERLTATCSANDMTPHDGPTNPLLFLPTDYGGSAVHGSNLVIPNTAATLPLESYARFLEHMDKHRSAFAAQVTTILHDYTLRDPPTGTAFLQIRTLPNNIRNHWISKPYLANRVIGNLVEWAAPRHEIAASNVPALFCRKLRVDHAVGSESSGGVMLFPPRPRGIGAGIWVLGRKPLTKREQANSTIKMRIGDRAVWDSRFRIALKTSKTPAPFHGIDPSQVRFVVRMYTERDEHLILDLMQQEPRTAWNDEVIKLVDNYRKKMPTLLRKTIPCVAVLQDNGDASYVIAVPSLRVNLQPTLVDIQFAFIGGSRFNSTEAEGIGFKLPSEQS